MTVYSVICFEDRVRLLNGVLKYVFAFTSATETTKSSYISSSVAACLVQYLQTSCQAQVPQSRSTYIAPCWDRWGARGRWPCGPRRLCPFRRGTARAWRGGRPRCLCTRARSRRRSCICSCTCCCWHRATIQELAVSHRLQSQRIRDAPTYRHEPFGVLRPDRHHGGQELHELSVGSFPLVSSEAI